MTNDERKKAIRAEVETRLVPYLASLGFRHFRQKLDSREHLYQGKLYRRRRDQFQDEIAVVWRAYNRPYFTLEFWTSDHDRMRRPGRPDGALARDVRITAPDHRPRWLIRITNVSAFARVFLGSWFDIWYGEKTNAQRGVDDAIARINELDAYLRGGPIPGGLSFFYPQDYGRVIPQEQNRTLEA